MNYSASFADMGQSTQPVASDAADGQARALLVFHLGDRAYGLAVEYVVQIIAMIKLTPVPQAEQVIEGVANIRGKIVPVLSARRHLGLPMKDLHLYTPIILLQTGERTIGLIVDEVADVVRLPAHQMAGPDTILPMESEETGLLEGVVYQGETVIMVINPRSLLNPSQARDLRRIGTENVFGEAFPAEPAADQYVGPRQVAGSEPAAGAQPRRRAGGKKQPAENGHGKSHKGRRNFDQTLAGEIAGLAVDLPPSEGQPPIGDEISPQDNVPA